MSIDFEVLVFVILWSLGSSLELSSQRSIYHRYCYTVTSSAFIMKGTEGYYCSTVRATYFLLHLFFSKASEKF